MARLPHLREILMPFKLTLLYIPENRVGWLMLTPQETLLLSKLSNARLIQPSGDIHRNEVWTIHRALLLDCQITLSLFNFSQCV
jgi:hypothetical protein